VCIVFRQEPPGATRSCQEPPGAAREPPGAARCQGAREPGLPESQGARSRQMPGPGSVTRAREPGAARSREEPPGAVYGNFGVPRSPISTVTPSEFRFYGNLGAPGRPVAPVTLSYQNDGCTKFEEFEGLQKSRFLTVSGSHMRSPLAPGPWRLAPGPWRGRVWGSPLAPDSGNQSSNPVTKESKNSPIVFFEEILIWPR